jgi:glycosyltransferase involved in cell wall biosynthesis
VKLSVPRPQHGIEIIVIDNNSFDDTKALVMKCIASSPFEMKYIFEPKQGVSSARNRAISEAKGDYIFFLDDDCLVEPDWLSMAVSDILEFHPCVIGGPYLGAFLPGSKPKWFKVEYGNAYFLDFHYKRGFHASFRASGANMAVRRDAFERLRFDESLGMKGDKLGLHEEVDLQQRYLDAHPLERTFYEPAFVVRQLILGHKMRLSYRAKRLFESSFSSTSKIGQRKILMSLVRVGVQLVLAPLKCLVRNRAEYPFWQNYAYEMVLPLVCPQIGALGKTVLDKVKKLHPPSLAAASKKGRFVSTFSDTDHADQRRADVQNVVPN